MTDQAQQNPEMLAALQALLAQAQQQPQSAGIAAGGGWGQPAPAASLPITGLSIPIKVETPLGGVRVDLHFPAEFGQSPQALLGAIQMLANAGYPVDAWKPREQGWGGGGNSGGGGWGGNGNNYAGGASYGRGGYGGGRRW